MTASGQSAPLCRNIEIKARVASLQPIRSEAVRIASEGLGQFRQVDTYFQARYGRLKLRRTERQPTELIWYLRPDDPCPKASDYRRIVVEDAAGIESALAAAWGVWIVVDKVREVLLYHNVRIHLDEVVGLGSFVELEAVLDSPDQSALGRSRLEFLVDELEIPKEAFVAGSYSDLLAATPAYNCREREAAVDC